MNRSMKRILSGGLAVWVLLAAAVTGVYAQGADAAGAGHAAGNGNAEAETDGYINGQPNYVYRAMGSIASDELFGQQWGLYNDGSFVMEEKGNQFPVFDDPFEAPWDEGEWNLVFNWGDEANAAGGRSLVSPSKKVSSVKGVDINVQEAWDRFDTNGREVIVAIIDTGVDYTNQQLADAIWVNEGEIPGDGIDNDGNGYVDDVYGWNFYDGNNKVFAGDEDNHGTHGAGTIAAARDSEGTAGIVGSSNVKIMVLKALGGKDGTGTTESIMEAIKYAEANGASICNLSLGTTGNDQTLRKAIADSNMLFVAAAGNGSDWTGSGQNTDRYPTYPAAWNLNNLISVANIQPDGTLHSSSNYGANTIDIAAPGSYILSTVTGGDYSYMTGTSMAAPMVAGVAAMLYTQYDDLTAAEARNIILTSAAPMDSLSGKVRTGGMLDAGAALALNRAEAKDYASAGSGADADGSTGGNAGGDGPAAVPAPDQNRGPISTPGTGSGGSGGQTAPGKGSAPVIRIFTGSELGLGRSRYLTVNVTDSDGDLKAVRYAEGTKGAAWFEGGGKGTSFTLDRNGNGNFTYSDSGTYTFYAVDSKGNETVSTVNLKGGGARSVFSDFADMLDWVMRF